MKYVVLEFDSDDEADSFSEALNAVGYVLSASEKSSMWKVYPRVKGIFRKPSQFCECAKPGEKSVRGAKWGWWIHRDCGKPKRGQWQHPRNLLDPIDLPARERAMYLGVVEGGKKYGTGGPGAPKGL